MIKIIYTIKVYWQQKARGSLCVNKVTYVVMVGAISLPVLCLHCFTVINYNLIVTTDIIFENKGAKIK